MSAKPLRQERRRRQSRPFQRGRPERDATADPRDRNAQSGQEDRRGRGQARHQLKHGGTTAEGADKVLTTAYAHYADYWGKNPDTGAAWGNSDVNAVQAGVKHQA
jgi:hypothetical protein